MMLVNKCEKCGQRMDNPLAHAPKVNILKMVGGRTVSLCIACVNQWHEYITHSDLWFHWVRNCAKRDYLEGLCASGRHVKESRWKELHDDCFRIMNRFFILSGEWLDDRPDELRPSEPMEIKDDAGRDL